MKTDYDNVNMIYRMYQQWMRNTVRYFVLSKIIAENIKDVINPDFEVTVDENVTIKPRSENVHISEWDAQVSRIAKWIGEEPLKTMSNRSVTAVFRVYHSRFGTIFVTVKADNTEQCDMTTVFEQVEKTVPTGYCAMLLEKRYLK